MDTLIYILIAIAITLFQVYNEKKKKEELLAKRKAQQRENEEYEDIHLSTERYAHIGEEAIVEHSSPYEYQEMEEYLYGNEELKSYEETEEPQMVNFNLDELHKVIQRIEREEANQANIEVAEAQANQTTEAQKEANNPLFTFDPKLFVLYSEIARPKFEN